jgi:xanthine dehydrogenase accessory factor
MDQDRIPIDIYHQAVQWIDEGRRFAAAVVLSADGSTPQRAAARALVDAGGRIFGTLGGGWIEAQSQRRAVEACRANQPTVLEFHLDSGECAAATQPHESQPICGGAMRILLDPTAGVHRQCYAAAAEALDRRQRGLLVTTLRATASAEEVAEVAVQWVPEDAITSSGGFPGGEAMRSCLTREVPRLFADRLPSGQAAVEVFVEPVVPRPLLLVAGGGHVGQALALQAVQLGFDVTVVDDRPEFANPDIFPSGVSVRCGPMAQEMAALASTPGAYLVIVTRGHQHDAETLAACIHAPVAYIGMIGSRRKVGMIRADLLRRGVASESELDRVFAPIGLEIGAVTVPEIATSIAAQLIAIRRGVLSRR